MANKFSGGGISYNQITHQVSLRLKQKAYCYLYFDKKDIPIIDKFYINDETSNKTTKELEVTLHLKWSDPYITDYCITETNNVDSCNWIPSNGVTEISSNYTLSNSEGIKTIYAYIKDVAQGISEVKSDSIEYIPPTTGESMVNKPISGVLESTGEAMDELAVRYYGTNPANYICFNTNDKSTCLGNQDKYMYRIIGIDKSGRLKLIKKTSIDVNGSKEFYWHNNVDYDVAWQNSDLYKGLNGITGGNYSNLFIGNNTYIQNSDWENKIEIMAWKYGDYMFANQTAAQILKAEQSFGTLNAKIGLMHMADYYYAYQKDGVNCSGNSTSTYPTCKLSWMHISNNDNYKTEWMIARYGSYQPWSVSEFGYITSSCYSLRTMSVRPTFYLIPEVEISGSGTASDPYLIVN